MYTYIYICRYACTHILGVPPSPGGACRRPLQNGGTISLMVESAGIAMKPWHFLGQLRLHVQLAGWCFFLLRENELSKKWLPIWRKGKDLVCKRRFAGLVWRRGEGVG